MNIKWWFTVLIGVVLHFIGSEAAAAATGNNGSDIVLSPEESALLREETDADNYLKGIEAEYSLKCHNHMVAQFEYASDIRNETTITKALALKEFSKYGTNVKLELHMRFPNWRKFTNDFVRNQIKMVLQYGEKVPPREVFEKYVAQQDKVVQIQNTVKMCDFQNKTSCNLRLIPDIVGKLRSNPSLEEATYYITGWYDTVGSVVTPELYSEYVNLSNQLAQAQGYKHYDDIWASGYDDLSSDWTPQKFKDEMISLQNQITPYYNKLHAYVRMMLKRNDPEKAAHITKEGYIPLHILNTLWGHDWTLIADKTFPFPNSSVNNEKDITLSLEEAGFTPIRIVQEAERFFTSLDSDWQMPPSFWEKSLFERPKDREAYCHPSAFDCCMNQDVRLHMCIKVSDSNLKTAYHEVGHLVYYKAYRHLPYLFRMGANPGFHEAVGDTISLSVTSKHLKCNLNLTLQNSDSIDCERKKRRTQKYVITEEDINTLYIKALSKIPSLPFGMSVSRWRSRVFDGRIPLSEFNTAWWETRKQLSGIIPPSPRNPKFLDIGALYHTGVNLAYINYFVSGILQFQFYEALCIAAGEYDPNDEMTRPLHQCDFANSLEAGMKLKNMLSKGASQSWKNTLEEFTGSRELSMKPLLDYFKPLFDHIDKELEKNNVPACFGDNCGKHWKFLFKK